MAYVMRGLPTDDYGTGRYMLYPEAPSGLNYKLAEDPNSRAMSSDEQKAYYRANRLFQAPIVVDSISYLDGDEFDSKFPSGVLQGAGSPNQVGEHDPRPGSGYVVKGEVVKVVLSSRLNRTPRAESQPVSNTGDSWNAYSLHDRWLADNGLPHEIPVGGGRVTFGGERSDENRIIELLIHRWRTYSAATPSLPNAFPIRRLGDFAPSATTSLASEPIGASNMGGNVFCRLGFLKLVPRVYRDNNNVSQRHDTRTYSHLFRHIEMLTRASCGAFFDLESNKNNLRHVPGTSGRNSRCEYLAPPKDYTMEHLVSERATAPQSGENLAIQKLEPSIPRSDGFGPIPNLEVTSGFFNEYSKVVNALVGCSIPGAFVVSFHRMSRFGTICHNDGTMGTGCRQYRDVPSTPWLDGNGRPVLLEGTNLAIYRPFRESKEVAGVQPFNPPGLVTDDDYSEVEEPPPIDVWTREGSGTNFQVSGIEEWDFARPGASGYWTVSGSTRIGVWASIGTEEFMQAFDEKLRAYLTKNSLGRPTMPITELGWGQSTGVVETEEQGGRTYARLGTDNFLIVGQCQVLTGGQLQAPATRGSMTVLATLDSSESGLAAGRQANALHHNVAGAADAVLVIHTQGSDDFQPPSCEIVLRVDHGAWYQVVSTGDEETDGAGIKYGLLPEDEYGERPVFLPGELFTVKEYPSSDAGRVFERVFNQVDTSKPSKVCKRTDLPPPPERFYTP